MPATPHSYLTIDGITGSDSGTGVSSTAGSIEVLEFSFSVSHVGSQPPGQPRSVEAVTRTPLTVKKKVDKRSPKLFKACCRAAIFSEAELVVYATNPDNPYAKYKMKGVHVSGFSTASSDHIPEETLQLTFDQMKVTFDNAGIGTEQEGNTATGSVDETWNWIMEVPGFTWMPTGNI
jgi:type VI secretion system Hcp family effector